MPKMTPPKERCISTVNTSKVNVTSIQANNPYLSYFNTYYLIIKKIKILIRINRKNVKNIELLGNNFHTVISRNYLKMQNIQSNTYFLNDVCQSDEIYGNH